MEPRDSPAPKGGFRPDIEGLRAIAILAVLLCHAGVPFLAGGYVGVDVFFVISGFLITGLLVRELEGTGRVSIARFYARRARRLLPLLALVLLVVVVGSLLLFSPLRSKEVSGDVFSSTFYFANWHFAAGSVDYFAQGTEPSPVQHLWSLAIEEQFYVVWPLVMLGIGWLAMRGRGAARGILLGAVVVLGLASLVYGIGLTGSEPKVAYFDTFGRAWELALGAGLALLGTAVRLRHLPAAALGWAGLAAIVYASVAFDEHTGFPGTAALVPTLGAAALIFAGGASRGAGPGRILGTGPARYVGRVSYSWYLWHWPALIFAAALFGTLSPWAGLAVVAVSLLPTVLSHHLYEEPLRRARGFSLMPRRALALGLACLAVAAVAGVALERLQPELHTAPISAVKGAAALPEEPTPQKSSQAVRPNPIWARKDRSQMYDDGCLVKLSGTRSDAVHCVYGDPNSSRTVFLFGDSHAMQYFPAIVRIARSHNWRLVTLAKTECTPADVPIFSETEEREYGKCETWRERSLERIEAAGENGTVLISGATEYTPLDGEGGDRIEDSEEATAVLRAGYAETLARLHDAGLRLAVIKDPPAAGSDVPGCVSRELEDLQSCAFERERDEADEYDARAAETEPGVDLIDVTNEICPGEICRAVIGNALVYRDKSHLSATFARTLAPGIERDLEVAGLAS